MNRRNKINSGEASDASQSYSNGSHRGDTKKPSIYENHWIFKKNKCILPRKTSQETSKAYKCSVKLYHSNYEKFITHLRHVQQSLQCDSTFKVINQTVDDSEDIKDLFGDLPVCRKSNFKLEAIVKADSNNKEKSSGSSFATSTITSRASRLIRRCNVLKKTPGDSLSDDDFDIGKSIFSKREDQNRLERIITNSKEQKVDDDSNNCNNIVVNEEKGCEKSRVETSTSSYQPDDLLEDHALHPTKKKKRKLELQSSNTIMDSIKNATKIITDSIGNYSKLSLKKPAAANGQRKLNGSKKVIEITEIEVDDDVIPPSITEETQRKSQLNCPMCNKLFSSEDINDHAYLCQGPQTAKQTRSRKNNQQTIGLTYNESDWESACKGLKRNDAKVEPGITVSRDNMKDSMAHLKSSSKVIRDMKTNGKSNGSARLRPLVQIQALKKEEKDAILDGSTRQMIEGYAKTLNTISKKSHAKPVRSFDESQNDEDDKVRCVRCGEHFADNELKTHTDSCLNQSMIEGD